MTVTPRLFIAAVLGSSVVGGTVGALATAATTSQASPQAIAAAVQKVQDQTAEKYLRTIGIELLGVIPLEGDLKQLKEDSESIRKNTDNICWDTASSLQRPSCVP